MMHGQKNIKLIWRHIQYTKTAVLNMAQDFWQFKTSGSCYVLI